MVAKITVGGVYGGNIEGWFSKLINKAVAAIMDVMVEVQPVTWKLNKGGARIGRHQIKAKGKER